MNRVNGFEALRRDASPGNVWYVDAQDGNDTNERAPTWNDAFQTIERALDDVELSDGSDGQAARGRRGKALGLADVA